MHRCFHKCLSPQQQTHGQESERKLARSLLLARMSLDIMCLRARDTSSKVGRSLGSFDMHCLPSLHTLGCVSGDTVRYGLGSPRVNGTPHNFWALFRYSQICITRLAVSGQPQCRLGEALVLSPLGETECFARLALEQLMLKCQPGVLMLQYTAQYPACRRSLLLSTRTAAVSAAGRVALMTHLAMSCMVQEGKSSVLF